MPARLFLFHWNAGELAERLRALRELGHAADGEAANGARAVEKILAAPPAAILIDLARLPSHGRAMAWYLRERKATRAVPLLILRGAAEPTARLERELPDAVFATWRGIRGALRRALRGPLVDPIVPRSESKYAGRSLVHKLGIRAGAKVALLGAPAGFRDRLGPLPDGVEVAARARNGRDLVLLFARSRAELERRLPAALDALGTHGVLWLAWRKRSSGAAGDLDSSSVRAVGLATGRVDFKVCAIDATWSGHAFGVRRAAAGRRRMA